MSESALIKDTDESTFMADVIEGSKDALVLVDFWAPWCGPCRQLMPVLEKAVAAQDGAVRLCKVNLDENRGLAGQMRVQSVPAVFAFKDGQPVDGFMGALPESEIVKFIGRHTGAVDIEVESEALFERAIEGLNNGDMGGAAQDLASALQVNPAHAGALATLARMYLESGAPEQASGLIEGAPDEVRDHPDIAAVCAQLSLGENAAHDDELAPLRAAVNADDKNLDAKLALAKALAASGSTEEAIDNLLASIAQNRAHDEQAARLFLLTIFEAEGPNSELARNGRARLSSILFA